MDPHIASATWLGEEARIFEKLLKNHMSTMFFISKINAITLLKRPPHLPLIGICSGRQYHPLLTLRNPQVPLHRVLPSSSRPSSAAHSARVATTDVSRLYRSRVSCRNSIAPAASTKNVACKTCAKTTCNAAVSRANTAAPAAFPVALVYQSRTMTNDEPIIRCSPRLSLITSRHAMSI